MNAESGWLDQYGEFHACGVLELRHLVSQRRAGNILRDGYRWHIAGPRITAAQYAYLLCHAPLFIKERVQPALAQSELLLISDNGVVLQA